MVKTISLETGIKDIQPKRKLNIEIQTSNNIDFLELLLNKQNNAETENSLKENPKKDDIEDDVKDNEKEKKIDLKIDLKNLISTSTQTEEDNKKLTEIKNIISSNLKQNNILLSKQEETEFKKIDNMKDLVKFADKKGLNIENIKIEVKKLDTKEKNISNIIDKQIQLNTKTIKTEKITKESITNQIIKDTKSLETSKTPSKQIDKSEKTINLEKILNSTEKKIDKNEKTTKHTDKKKIVNNNKNLLNIHSENNNLQTIKTTKTGKTTLTEENQKTTSETAKLSKKDIDLTSLLNIEKPKNNKTTKTEINSNNIINTTNNQTLLTNDLKVKTLQVKDTLDNFKNNLDEAIKNYKPPISKVNIELNPKNLGKVEVTIIQRGNNIQVNMNSDQSNINMFQTHQAEFRQALSSIGFNNIDMSFSSNQDRDRKQNQAKKVYSKNSEIEDIGEIEIKADYRYA